MPFVAISDLPIIEEESCRDCYHFHIGPMDYRCLHFGFGDFRHYVRNPDRRPDWCPGFMKIDDYEIPF